MPKKQITVTPQDASNGVVTDMMWFLQKIIIISYYHFFFFYRDDVFLSKILRTKRDCE